MLLLLLLVVSVSSPPATLYSLTLSLLSRSEPEEAKTDPPTEPVTVALALPKADVTSALPSIRPSLLSVAFPASVGTGDADIQPDRSPFLDLMFNP